MERQRWGSGFYTPLWTAPVGSVGFTFFRGWKKNTICT